MKRVIISLLAIPLLLTACTPDFDRESDFRNFLRDKHPYSELIEVNEFDSWGYQVNDTIKGETWIYLGGRNEHHVKKLKVECCKPKKQ